MKFLLVLSVCSASFQTCLPPIKNDELYNSHFDCATAGYLNAMGMMRDIGVEQTNEQRIVISFQCKETPIAGVHHRIYNQ